MAHDAAPTFMKRNNMWWCQSLKGHYLITGVGVTRDDAEKAWKDELKQLERELKQSQP